MPLTLDSIVLPDGLYLELADDLWSPVVQSAEYTLTGALVLEDWAKASGRPLTLVGGRSGTMSFARMTRTDLLALKAALDATTPRTLTLLDGRTFRVVPRRTDGPALEATPLPGVADRPPSDPPADWPYVIERIRLLEVPA